LKLKNKNTKLEIVGPAEKNYLLELKKLINYYLIVALNGKIRNN
jgi:hypothetical protein